MSNIVINGKSYPSGSTIVVNGTGSVSVDGVEVRSEKPGPVHIMVNGNIGVLNVESCDDLTINGVVNGGDIKATVVNIHEVKSVTFD